VTNGMGDRLRQNVTSRRNDTRLISNLIAKNCSLRVRIIIAAKKITVTDLGLCFLLRCHDIAVQNEMDKISFSGHHWLAFDLMLVFTSPLCNGHVFNDRAFGDTRL